MDTDEDEARSDTSEQEQDYGSDVSSSVSEQDQNVLLSDLINNKINAIFDFINGNIDTIAFKIELATLNKRIAESDFDLEIVDQNILDEQLRLNGILAIYEKVISDKIKELPQEKLQPTGKSGIYSRFSKKDVLGAREMQELIKIRERLVRDEPEQSFEPLPSNRLIAEWEGLTDLEKEFFEQIAGNQAPKFEQFLYSSNPIADYNRELANFLDTIDIFLSSYWQYYESMEEDDIFGFVYKTGITKPGGYYEKVMESITQRNAQEALRLFKQSTRAKDPIPLTPEQEEFIKRVQKPLKLQIKEIIKLINKLPIQLTNNEKLFIKRIEFIKEKLKTFTKEQLLKCINNTKGFKPNYVQKSYYPKNLSPESRVLFDKLVNYERPKREQTEITSYRGRKPLPLVQARTSAKQRIAAAFQSVPESLKTFKKQTEQGMETINLIIYFTELLENKIYKLTEKTPEEYYAKINDIIFILGHYPDVKEKVLQGVININDLALFERAIMDNIKGKVSGVYPSTVRNRQESIKNIFNEIMKTNPKLISKFKNIKLASSISRRKAKELERFVFDVAVSQADYFAKIKYLIDFIRKNDSTVFKPMSELSKLFIKTPKQKQQKSYISLNDREIQALLSQYQYELQNLEIKFSKNPEIGRKEISKINSKIKELENIHIKRVKRRHLDYANRYKSMLMKKYGEFPKELRVSIQQPKIYPVIDQEIIKELVNAVKRKQIGNNLFELYDLNELNKNKMVVYAGKLVRSIPENTYLAIKKYILKMLEVQNILNVDVLNKSNTLSAINQIAKAKNLNFEITTISAAIKYLTENWGTTWNGEQLKDTYGENVFKKLLNVGSPFDFYRKFTIKDYDTLVNKFTPKKEEIYRKPQAEFDGKWYNVSYVDKNWSTGEPLFVIKEIPIMNNGKPDFVRQIDIRPGKYPFVLRKLATNQEGVFKDVWTEVPLNKVKYRSIQFGKRKLTKRKLCLKKKNKS
jgi:hypothetical protein